MQLRPIIFGSFLTGFSIGLIPNRISLYINDKRCTALSHYKPIIFGITSVVALGCLPFITVLSITNSSLFDKVIDKYDVSIERWHQYDGNDNKYAYPSIIQINLRRKSE